jgi:protein-export membrane protein SecD/preprotein translocase SecF subunit
MTDKNLYVRIALIVLIVTLCVWAIWPPREQLKAGIDLAGGTSLLYEIDTAGLAERDKTDLAERVMRRLKQRVDPQGQRNLVWRPIGQNRLEIQMPRPPKEMGQRRDVYEKAREVLRMTRVDRGDIEAALALTGPAREAAIEKLYRGVPERKTLFANLVAAKDKVAAGDTTKVKVTSRPAAESQAAMAALDEAREQYYEGFDKILATNVNLDRLSDILALGTGDKDRAAKLAEFKTAYVERLADSLGVSKEDNARAEKIASLRSECAGIFADVDKLTEAYDEWAKNKGALEDPSDLMRLLRGQGVLEFRILAEKDPANPDMIGAANSAYREPISRYTEQLAKYGPRRRSGDNFQWFRIGKPDEFKPAGNPIEADYLGTKYVLAFATPDMGLLNDRTWQLTRAVPDRDQRGRWSVSFTLDPAGGARFEKLTEANKGHPLCILLDGEAMSAPNIQSAIREHGQITGDFTLEEVTRLCNVLEAGSLDARLKDTPLSIQTIGPSLGEQNRTMGMQACVTALIAVVAFMAIYYLYGGVISDIALMLNMIITLGIMALIQGTFTLQGIAGLVLTLGMAVDANVLIFERIREEQARGVSLKTAVKLGYDRAFWVIFDSNLTTVISAVILGYVGTEEIKGFALTLGLGLCVSMFTALFVTRQFFNVLVQTRVSRLETERCWGGSAILAAAGGLIFGLGWVVNRHQREWYHSGLAGLGEFLLVGAATALVLLSLIWIMRWIAIATGAHKTNKIPMLYLLKPTNVDWMGKQKYFWTVSGVLTLGGLLLFALQPKKNLLDIEFLGGTAVQVTLEPKSKDKPVQDAEVEAVVRGTQDRSQAAGWMAWAAGRLESAEVKKQDDGSFLVLSNDLTEPQIDALVTDTLEDKVPKNWITSAPGGLKGACIRLKDNNTSLDAFRQDILAAAKKARGSAEDLATSARVQAVSEYQAASAGPATAVPGREAFEIVTTDTNKKLVGEAVLAALAQHDDFTVRVERGIGFQLVTDPQLAPDGAFPIQADDRTLGDAIGPIAGPATTTSVARYKGGLVMVFDKLEPAQTLDAIRQRLRDMRLQPDYERYGWRESDVIGLGATGAMGTAPDGKPAPTFTKVAIAVSDENLPFYDNEETWRRDLAKPELQLAQSALSSERSLDKVTTFAPQVAAQAAQQAVMALVLALIAMVAYLWFRFGTMEYGLGAIIALIHDVAVALGLITATHWIAKTPIGHFLLINEMRIDLAVVAAFLTIVGYSVNDTIVVFDRIRENRGRLATLSPRLINDAINQTIPRTILTAFTVFLVVLILYVIGGPGVHSFAFAMLIGTLTGCYSSVAIASPILYKPTVMRAMLALIVLVTAIGLIIGGESLGVRVGMGVVAAVVLGLIGLWQLRKRGAEMRPQAA